MNPDLSEEQQAFAETTRKFLKNEVPLTKIRELYDSIDGFEREWWQGAASLGWTSMFVPESLGGGSLSGGPTSDAAIVAEEMGRLLSPGPFLPVNLVAAALARDGSEEQQKTLLPALLDGGLIASWAFAEPGRSWESSQIEFTATEDGGEIVLAGTKAYVEAAGVADYFLVAARSGSGLTQVLVPAETPGVTVSRGRSVDMTRRFGSVRFDSVRLPSSAGVGPLHEAKNGVDRLTHLALALQCAEMVGIADRTLEFTLEYGRDRFAFGRPIVSFQALKHRIADMTVWLEGSKAVVSALASQIDNDGDDGGRLASVAKAYVGERCLDIVDDCVQLTGGIGVTWEHDIHMYNRRAVIDRALYGTPEEHKWRLFNLLGCEE